MGRRELCRKCRREEVLTRFVIHGVTEEVEPENESLSAEQTIQCSCCKVWLTGQTVCTCCFAKECEGCIASASEDKRHSMRNSSSHLSMRQEDQIVESAERRRHKTVDFSRCNSSNASLPRISEDECSGFGCALCTVDSKVKDAVASDPSKSGTTKSACDNVVDHHSPRNRETCTSEAGKFQSATSVEYGGTGSGDTSSRTDFPGAHLLHFPATHYVLLLYGVDGCPGDFDNVRNKLLMEHPHIHIHVPPVYVGKTSSGVVNCSEEVFSFLMGARRLPSCCCVRIADQRELLDRYWKEYSVANPYATKFSSLRHRLFGDLGRKLSSGCQLSDTTDRAVSVNSLAPTVSLSIVAHSFGGLIARALLEKFRSSGFLYGADLSSLWWHFKEPSMPPYGSTVQVEPSDTPAAIPSDGSELAEGNGGALPEEILSTHSSPPSSTSDRGRENATASAPETREASPLLPDEEKNVQIAPPSQTSLRGGSDGPPSDGGQVSAGQAAEQQALSADRGLSASSLIAIPWSAGQTIQDFFESLPRFFRGNQYDLVERIAEDQAHSQRIPRIVKRGHTSVSCPSLDTLPEWPTRALKVHLKNFITIATPHVGIGETSSLIKFFAKLIKGQTAKDLMLVSEHISVLAGRNAVDTLSNFENRTLVGCVTNDMMVGPVTSLLLPPGAEQARPMEDGCKFSIPDRRGAHRCRTARAKHSAPATAVSTTSPVQGGEITAGRMVIPPCLLAACKKYGKGTPVEIPTCGHVCCLPEPTETLEQTAESEAATMDAAAAESKGEDAAAALVSAQTISPDSGESPRLRATIANAASAAASSVKAIMSTLSALGGKGAAIPEVVTHATSCGFASKIDCSLRKCSSADSAAVQLPMGEERGKDVDPLLADLETLTAADLELLGMGPPKTGLFSADSLEDQLLIQEYIKAVESEEASSTLLEEKRDLDACESLRKLRRLKWRRFSVYFPNLFLAHTAVLWHGRVDRENAGRRLISHLVKHIFLP